MSYVWSAVLDLLMGAHHRYFTITKMQSKCILQS